MARWLPFALFALGTLAARSSLADELPRCELRLISEEAHRARVWRYSWTGINAALTIGSFTAVPLVTREDRPDWIISGAGSAITTLTTWFLPLDVEAAEDELLALPPDERSRRLPRLLAASAADERSRVTWPWHVANFGLSAIAGGVIAFGYDHYASGIITTVVSTTLGEVQLFTQPTGLASGCQNGGRWVPSVAWVRGPRQELQGGLLSLTGAF